MISLCINNIFQISDFLTDYESTNLFSTNKCFKTIFESHPELYTVKKLFYDLDLLHITDLFPYLSNNNIERFKKFKYSILYWTSNNNFDENKSIELKHVKTIYFSSYFNKKVDGLPVGLQKIVFGLRFNKKVDHLPKGLKYLEMGGMFNQSVDNLPEGLEYLILNGVDFDQPINSLPASLIELDLGESFNHPLDNLPEGLKTLRISSNYTHNIDNLPSTLTRLILDGDFNMQIKHLPEGLLYLHLGMNFNKKLDNLPNSLRTLILENNQIDISKINPQCKIYNEDREIEELYTDYL